MGVESGAGLRDLIGPFSAIFEAKMSNDKELTPVLSQEAKDGESLP